MINNIRSRALVFECCSLIKSSRTRDTMIFVVYLDMINILALRARTRRSNTTLEHYAQLCGHIAVPIRRFPWIHRVSPDADVAFIVTSRSGVSLESSASRFSKDPSKPYVLEANWAFPEFFWDRVCHQLE